MITINLLPVELRPVKRTPLPYIIAVAIAIVAGFMCFNMFIQDKNALNAIEATLKANEAEFKTHEANIAEYKELVATMKLLATKLTTINEIASDRLIWSFHLHTLSRLAPDNLWYESVEETTRTITEEIMVFDQAAKKQVPRKVKRVIPVLMIKGMISPDEQGQADINPFLAVLESDPEFSSMFQLEPPSLAYKEFEKNRVRTFELNCIIAPSTGETE